MPYIKEERKDQLRYMDSNYPNNPGELNYVLTRVILNYWELCPVKPGYQQINDILGALEGAKLEFYRRAVVPYENRKIKENGDVGYESF